MDPNKLVCAAFLAAGCGLFVPVPGFADDSAASIAAGGLVPRRETRIVMAKEVLRISNKKVVVDYDFRNDTDENVTTEVAFPIPPYSYDFDGPEISSASFSNFQVFADGQRVAFQTEAKATLNGKDVTGILTSDGIDIATFGHLHLRETDEPEVALHTPDVERLPEPEQMRLVQMGLFGTDRPWGTWTVHLQYHWTQTFPAHSIVHIRHEYAPVAGYAPIQLETFRSDLGGAEPVGYDEAAREQREVLQLLRGFCPESSFLRGAIGRLQALDEQTGGFAYPQWVDFILTSANTWKQPIEDFTLIIERGEPELPNSQRLISFCSPKNAPVVKLDADHFQAHLVNFVPQSELRIGFFDLPKVKSGPASSGKAR